MEHHERPDHRYRGQVPRCVGKRHHGYHPAYPRYLFLLAESAVVSAVSDNESAHTYGPAPSWHSRWSPVSSQRKTKDRMRRPSKLGSTVRYLGVEVDDALDPPSSVRTQPGAMSSRVSGSSACRTLAATRSDVISDGARVAMYLTGESGSPLLLIHSINAATSVAEVEPLRKRYGEHHCVCCIDLPGFGESERTDRAYTTRLMTNAMDAASLIHQACGHLVSFSSLSLAEIIGKFDRWRITSTPNTSSCTHVTTPRGASHTSSSGGSVA